MGIDMDMANCRPSTSGITPGSRVPIHPNRAGILAPAGRHGGGGDWRGPVPRRVADCAGESDRSLRQFSPEADPATGHGGGARLARNHPNPRGRRTLATRRARLQRPCLGPLAAHRIRRRLKEAAESGAGGNSAGQRTRSGAHEPVRLDAPGAGANNAGRRRGGNLGAVAAGAA